MQPNLRSALAATIHLAGRVPVLGAALRRIASQYREGSVVRIRSGLAAGYRWQRSHRYVNGCWTGQYELPMQQLLARQLRAGDVFWDVGANAGFFSLVAARLVGPTGRVVAFEPLPFNASTTRTQFALNALGNCKVVEAAVSDAEGEATFTLAESTAMAKLGEGPGQSVTVRTATLDAVRASEQRGPTFLKIDVEGAEALALAGARALLAERPRMVIELHGAEPARAVISTLLAAGYRVTEVATGRAVTPSDNPDHVLAHPA